MSSISTTILRSGTELRKLIYSLERDNSLVDVIIYLIQCYIAS